MEIIGAADGLDVEKVSCLLGITFWKLFLWCTQALALVFVALTLIFNVCGS